MERLKSLRISGHSLAVWLFCDPRLLALDLDRRCSRRRERCANPHFSRPLIECCGGLTSTVPQPTAVIWARLLARLAGRSGWFRACGVDVLRWAEGSAGRAVERGPCYSKDIGVGKGRCHREFDPADADADLGTDFEQLEPDGSAGGVGEAGRGESNAAQRADQDIGHGGQPEPQLVGAHGVGGGSVGEQIELTFFDTVFHLAAGAIELLVERAGLMVVSLQRGDDKARIGPAFQCRQVDVADPDGFLLAPGLCRALTFGCGRDHPLGLADDTALPAPALARPVLEVLEGA